MRARCLLAAAATVTIAGLLGWAGQAGSAPKSLNGFGLHIQAQARLDQRLFSYTVTTAALPKTANIRVLLPTGYFSHPQERYPVLYLLQPAPNDAEWVTTGHAEQTTAGKPLIVVMPSLALAKQGAGWCTNWVNGGKFGPPKWTTFHIDEVIPWVDHHFRTIANRGGRAIAGLSEGGFCAASYSARYPELFGTVSSYSGAVDLVGNQFPYTLTTTHTGHPEFGALIRAIINTTERMDHVPTTSMFGDPAKYELNWEDHDPTALAENLRNTNIYLYCGNGQPGPLTLPVATTPTPTHTTHYEALVTGDNAAFVKALTKLGIKSTFDAYGPGVHYWPYFTRDFQENLPAIMKDFTHPVLDPKSFTFKTVTPSYSIFGWKVAITRPAQEFSAIEHAGTGGFTLTGSGSAVVTTPDRYKAGKRYRVAISAGHVHRVDSIMAGRTGNLQITVPLGPGNPLAEDAPGAVTHVFTTNVRIS